MKNDNTVLSIMNYLRTVLGILNPRQKNTAIILVFMLVIGAVFETIGVAAIVPLIAVLTDENFLDKYQWVSFLYGYIGVESQYWIVFFTLLAVAILYLIKNIYLSYLIYLKIRYILNVRLKLSLKLFEGYLNKPYTFHMQKNTAQLIQAITRESDNYAANVLLPLLTLFGELFVIVGLIVLLTVMVSITTLLVLLVFLIVAFFVYKSTQHRMKRWGIVRQENEIKKLKEIQQGLNGISGFDRSGKAALQKGMVVRELPRLIFEIVALFCLLVVVFATIDSGNADQALTTLALFSVATIRLLPSFSKIISALHSLRYFSSAVYLLSKDLREVKDTVNTDKVINNSNFHFNDKIKVNSLDYSYPGSINKSLSKINIEIKSGQLVGIIGSSGAGKSTLVDLIIGLLPPADGSICVDGHNINENISGWQKHIGYVPQEIYLIDDTLKKNIAFGVPNEQIDESALWNAIKLAQLSTFIETQPDKLETVVGEHGVRMSGGQRQRVGIARALYNNPSIIVFDEATSALDSKTEASIMNAVTELKGKITIIMIAHRLTSLASCDVIFSLENGELVHEGSYESIS